MSSRILPEINEKEKMNGDNEKNGDKGKEEERRVGGRREGKREQEREEGRCCCKGSNIYVEEIWNDYNRTNDGEKIIKDMMKNSPELNEERLVPLVSKGKL